MRENIKLGQRIEGAAFDAWIEGSWKEVAAVSSVGANRLVRLPYNITTSKVRLRITKSPVAVAISDFGLFKEPVYLVAPVIKRNKAGEVAITTEAPVGSIRYTTDGSQPNASSPAYTKPFVLADGGEIRAISLDGSNKSSEVGAQTFGLAKSNWNVLSQSGNNAKKAIDEDTNTFATNTNSSELVVDMGAENTIKAFTYLPRQDKQTDGLVSGYRWAGSNDGITWQTVAEGEFSNIKSNPIVQLVSLKTAIKAKYFKLTAVKLISGTGISAAEIGAQIK